MIDATVCVMDLGLFTELAVRLSRDFSRVLYHVPWEAEFPLVNDRALGDGYEEIERIEDPLDPHILPQIDLFIFPDIYRAGLQLHLESLGKMVWGSRRADQLELDRVGFKKLQEKLGLPVGPYEVVRGMTELREYLQDHEDVFVKASSEIRGSWETLHHQSMVQSGAELARRELKFWSVREQIEFVIEANLNAELESGIDRVWIDGERCEQAIQGYEIKGQGIFMAVQKYSEMPKEITGIVDALAPTLADHQCRNFVSLEIKIKDGKGYCIDPCLRAPNPGIGAEMEMIDNLGDVIIAGAQGKIVEPEYSKQFGVQCAVYHDYAEDAWKDLEIDPDVRRWFKLMDFCRVGQVESIIPRVPYGTKVGWLIGVGDTIDEVVDHVKENAEKLKGLAIDIRLDSMYDALKEIRLAEKQDVEFTDQPVPEPEIALDHE